MEERALELLDNASFSPGTHDDNINISDVIEVIRTDLEDYRNLSPSGAGGSAMLNGTVDFSQVSPNPMPMPNMVEQEPYVQIIEQPASKALRFRYECEGRSAGSIPGISSIPENKTFPTIQIVGFRGRAVVVVSCVTKDAPYRPHPHNLVGREGCKKGVCTLEVPVETMSVTFSNLGIQCVKKKDIEGALKLREEIRVDPFKTGFAHRNQPTSIDLNAVRLCFQVFITVKKKDRKDEKKEVLTTIPLRPVISEPIYDKKAMCDLVIVKLSDCVSPVDGGRKDIILLCEKVTKEDIQIRFYEEKDGQLLWEGYGDFQPSQVHKQTAICFRAPRYKNLGITDTVKVFIQLKRPSDGATSEPLPFEFLPLDSGRPPFWSFRRSLSKKSLLNSILTSDSPPFSLKRSIDNVDAPLPTADSFTNTPSAPDTSQMTPVTAKGDDIEMVSVSEISSQAENVVMVVESPNTDTPTAPQMPAMNKEWCDYSEVAKPGKSEESKTEEDKSLSELIDQVAELDEIYSESRAISKLNENDEEMMQTDGETFNDSMTYTSLQMAFKNPLSIDLIENKYEDVVVVNPTTSPIIDLGTKRRESNIEPEDKLPPLPPKRAKKVITDICDPYIPDAPTLPIRSDREMISKSNPNLTIKPLDRSSSLKTQSQTHLVSTGVAPTKRLPPTPTSTLPNPHKRGGFFSKLFSLKKQPKSRASTPDTTTTTQSLENLKQKQRNSLIMTDDASRLAMIGKQSSSASAHSINSNGSQQQAISDAAILLKAPSTDLNANDDINQLNLDLTEAEHYALYMAMAPRATESEFDEMSCYYSPVEGGRIMSAADSNVVHRPLGEDSKT